MSFDLGVWFEPAPISAGQAGYTYELLCRADTSTVAANDAVPRFYEDVVARFPCGSHAGVWAVDPVRTGSHVILSIDWSRLEEVAEFVFRRAGELGLVCYDPQAGEVELPSRTDWTA
ncbi:hypothetical protein [Luedemannella flava]|uniref:hypothetical protein n=1 Tax=Luedemannella flava TaxID=349316 RepID=UPI0031D50D44